MSADLRPCHPVHVIDGDRLGRTRGHARGNGDGLVLCHAQDGVQLP